MPTDLTASEAKTWGDKVFAGVPVADELASLFDRYLNDHDFAANTRWAVANDLRKFALWFTTTNNEALALARITARDITDFKDHLRSEQTQAVATVNRGLVSLRRFLGWLTDQGHITNNPAKKVKELRHQRLAPKGLAWTGPRCDGCCVSLSFEPTRGATLSCRCCSTPAAVWVM